MPKDLSDDAAITAAVYALLARDDITVADLAFHIRVSAASLYRKLGGQSTWKASDVGAIARHFGVQPGDLFAGAQGPLRTGADVASQPVTRHTSSGVTRW